MTGITGLVDTLLAAKLSQRLDLLALKPEARLARPEAPIAARQVDNDVRLPSHAALDREIGAPQPHVPRPPAGSAQPPVHLTGTARLVDSLLGAGTAPPGPVRGTAPLLPQAPVAATAALAPASPSVPVLAQALAQAVSGSGLFYESHLQQFSVGTRTLEQLAAEPQARLTGQAGPAPGPAAGPVPGPAGGPSPGMPAAQSPAAPHGVALPAADHAASASDVAPLRERSDAATARVGEAGRMSDAQAPASTSAPAPAPATMGAATAATVHPATLPLVQQQLALLATDVFSWNGQAWPGVPMDWTIEQERTQPDGQADGAEAPPRRWRTTLALTLPRLGPVELTLSVSEQDVQARLAAPEPATRERLAAHSDDLARRLAGAGLRVQELQVVRTPAP